MNSNEEIPQSRDERRTFLKILLSGGLIALGGSILYPVLAYLKPPKQAKWK